MARLGGLAAGLTSRSIFGLELGVVLLWVVLASILSVVAAQVTDWNAMTDELVYERLAIAIGQSHSLIPTLHGGHVRSLAQLYPALISPWFSFGYVPESLRNAHIFNAWWMSSACFPAFFLARRITGRRWAAYTLATLAICTPWIIYTTVLLTEVAAYPAFLWALLGMHKAMTSPSARNDVLAILGLTFAFFARTQFALLAGVLPVALLLFRLTQVGRERPGATLRKLVRGHAVLVGFYVVLGAAVLWVEASGRSLYSLSVYGSQLSSLQYPPGAIGSVTGHAADLAFGLGILPFVVGVAWVLANVVRPPVRAELHAFASLVIVTALVLLWAITVWDLHIGNFVLDRYLYYLAPVVLLAFLCALIDERRPRWSLLVPVAVVAFGFATHLQAEFLWAGRFPLSTDSPIASLYKPIADLGGGRSGASTILVVATIALAVLFVAAARYVRHDLLTTVLVVALLVLAPIDTVHTFDKLFSRESHSGRPLTQSQGGVLDWVDRTVGTGATVTAVPYPISSQFFVSQQAGRDLEFWNKSVRYAVHYPTPDVYRDAVIWFPDNPIAFDPESGTASRSLSRYVLQSLAETRFRIAGPIRAQQSGSNLVEAEQPWRADWITSGLYDDGWMRPGEAAHVRVYATPGQRGPITRTLTLHLRTPPGIEAPYSIRSNLTRASGTIAADDDVTTPIVVCVPARGFADVRVTTPVKAPIPGDLKDVTAAQKAREGGLFFADMALADELGPSC